MLKPSLDVEEPIGLLVAAVRHRIKQAVGNHVRQYNLSSQQFWTLVGIAEHPGFSLGDLAAQLRMDKPTASRIVFALTSRRLAEVRGDTTDRRRARLYLTTPGETLMARLHPLAIAVRAAVVAGLSSSELSALRASLRKIIVNMDRFGNGQVAKTLPTAVRSARRSQPSAARRLSLSR